MKLKVGDKVRVITGKDKGKEGKITHTFKNENKVIVEGLNMVKKHVKPNNNNQTGGIIDMEAKIDASNVMFLDNNKTTRKVVRNEKNKTKKVEKKESKPVKKTTSKKTKEVADFLVQKGISAEHFHAGLKNETKDARQRRQGRSRRQNRP